MDLAPVAGLGLAAILEDARVQFSAQAEAMPALAAFKADAPEALALGQFTDRDFKDPGCLIKFQNGLSSLQYTIINAAGEVDFWRNLRIVEPALLSKRQLGDYCLIPTVWS
jgi:hypothetical protein